MKDYQPKYKHTIKDHYLFPQGSRERRERWKTGPDPITHDKYYAYMKHKAQAKYRGEDYSLTWEQWDQLWPTELFVRRGRKSHDLVLMQTDTDLGWHQTNVSVVERIEHLRRGNEYRERNK